MACVAVALCLCGAQIVGNTVAILVCLSAFIALVGWTCGQNCTLPILLFFLPWTQILRTSPSAFSFFTFGLVLVCAVSVVKNWRRFRRYHIIAGVGLLFLTLLSKLIDGSSLSFDYIAFMMLLLLFPVVKEECTAKNYGFFHAVIFFSAGVVLAALCAQSFAAYPNISKYINVHSYLTIRRMCGFYGDPNFYTAQITAALGSCLILLLKVDKKSHIFLFVGLGMILIYCGLLSGSKSFAIISAILLLLWAIEVIKIRGRTGFKVALLIGSGLAVIVMAVSSVVSGMLDVLATRFSYADDLSGFTTGRTDVWLDYGRELLENWKILFLGKGFTKSIINGKSSHNTIIQIFYQLGLLGAPFLILWIVCFFRSGRLPQRSGKKQVINRLILLTGTILPWFAIDALFFDEFFLLQWFIFLGLQQLHAPVKEGDNDGRT